MGFSNPIDSVQLSGRSPHASEHMILGIRSHIRDDSRERPMHVAPVLIKHVLGHAFPVADKPATNDHVVRSSPRQIPTGDAMATADRGALALDLHNFVNLDQERRDLGNELAGVRH